MATNVSWNGVTYSVPATSEEDWSGSTKVDGLLIALATHGLQKSGGLFTLTADIDFGATAGLQSLYYKSRSSDLADSGILRLAKTDTITWRNNANDGNNTLTTSSDALVYSGSVYAASSANIGISGGASFQNNSGDASFSGGIRLNSNSAQVTVTGSRVFSSIGYSASIFQSVTANPADSGILRLARADFIGWRNQANSANLLLSVSTNNLLQFDSNFLVGVAGITSGDLIYADSGTSFASLAIGSDNQILKINGSSIEWGQQQLDELPQLDQDRIIGRVSSGSGNAESLTGTQATTILDEMVGDSGSGGTKGLVPAPSTGDATKVLSGAGTWIAANADVTTTKGDIIARSSSAIDRLAVGENGQVLAADSGETLGVGYKWPGGESSAKSADYTVLDNDGVSVILMTRSTVDRTVTLPTAADNADRELVVKIVDDSTGDVIIDGEGSETIDGATTYTMSLQYEKIRLKCDGTSWHIIERYIPTVKARYTRTTAQEISDSTTTILDFATQVVDSHSTVTTGASWKFTAPRAGWYTVSVRATLESYASWAAGEYISLELYKDGSLVGQVALDITEAAVTKGQAAGGSISLELAKDEYIDIRMYHDAGAALDIGASAATNWISINSEF